MAPSTLTPPSPAPSLSSCAPTCWTAAASLWSRRSRWVVVVVVVWVVVCVCGGGGGRMLCQPVVPHVCTTACTPACIPALCPPCLIRLPACLPAFLRTCRHATHLESTTRRTPSSSTLTLMRSSWWEAPPASPPSWCAPGLGTTDAAVWVAMAERRRACGHELQAGPVCCVFGAAPRARAPRLVCLFVTLPIVFTQLSACCRSWLRKSATRPPTSPSTPMR